MSFEPHTPEIYALTAMFAGAAMQTRLEWCVGHGEKGNNAFKLNATCADGGSFTIGAGLDNVLREPNVKWLTGELARIGVELDESNARRIVHEYVFAVTGKPHPKLVPFFTQTPGPTNSAL